MPTAKEKGEEEKEKEEEEEQPLKKSNNPHQAGGEQLKFRQQAETTS